MLFIETRGNDGQHSTSVPFSEAILNPMASFGGLYSPQTLPDLPIEFLQSHITSSYKQLAFSVLKAFEVDIDDNIINQAIALYDNFDDETNPLPVVKVNEDLFVSEL
ncbi:MAG: threonine synthase, partial [Gammaproteobacteria bacterium]|nr:threonine synthase [Gammaproteobacteria bacterium]